MTRMILSEGEGFVKMGIENRKYKATEEELKIPGDYLLSILQENPDMSAKDMLRIYLREYFLHIHMWDASLEQTERIVENMINGVLGEDE